MPALPFDGKTVIAGSGPNLLGRLAMAAPTLDGKTVIAGLPRNLLVRLAMAAPTPDGPLNSRQPRRRARHSSRQPLRQTRRGLHPRIAIGRSGMSLVEVVVSLLISIIVIGLSVGLIIFSTNYLSRTELRAEDKQIAEDAADYVRDRLLYARGIQVVRADDPPFGSLGAGGGNRGGELVFIGKKGADGKVHIANSGSLYYMRSGDSEAIDVLGAARFKGSELALSYQAIINAQAPAGKPEKTFRVILNTIRGGKPVYGSTKTFSLYDADAASEPTESLAISSWSSEDGFENATDLASLDTDAHFYLLVDASSTGYVQSGLLAHFDAISNSLLTGPNAQAHHDPFATTIWSDISGNGNDMSLVFTDVAGSNPQPVRDQTLYFDGSGDYGVINSLDLSGTQAVTVEVCFREAVCANEVMLIEYSTNWNNNVSGFGVALNSSSARYDRYVVHTNMGLSTTNASADRDRRPVNYRWADATNTLTTHSNYFSMKAGEQPRRVWIDGQPTGLITAGTTSTPVSSLAQYTGAGRYFVPQPLYLASRGGANANYQGEIASVRIYDRLLTDAEIRQNAQEDKARFGF